MPTSSDFAAVAAGKLAAAMPAFVGFVSVLTASPTIVAAAVAVELAFATLDLFSLFATLLAYVYLPS